MDKVASYLQLLRVKHYIKNVLIFIPLLFSGQFFDCQKLSSGVCGFLSFCLLSSAVYIFNDIKDVEKDKMHPRKSKRPIAAGKISKKCAVFVMVVCVCASIAILLLREPAIHLVFCLILYFVLNILYSYGLKNIPLVDVVILVMGFLLRLIYGAQITNIEISGWLYLTVVAISFYMGLGKRRNEIGKDFRLQETRPVLKYYSYDFLDKNMYLCLTLTNAFYALWAMSHESKILLWTMPIVLIITMRYSLDIESENSEGDPVEVILGDKILWVLGVSYLSVVMGVLYFT